MLNVGMSNLIDKQAGIWYTSASRQPKGVNDEPTPPIPPPAHSRLAVEHGGGCGGGGLCSVGGIARLLGGTRRTLDSHALDASAYGLPQKLPHLLTKIGKCLEGGRDLKQEHPIILHWSAERASTHLLSVFLVDKGDVPAVVLGKLARDVTRAVGGGKQGCDPLKQGGVK